MDTITISVTDLADTVELNITDVIEAVQIEVSEPGEQKEVREDWVEPYDYIGKAGKNSLETDSVWKIFRIQINSNGSVSIQSASGAKWTERLTITYA